MFATVKNVPFSEKNIFINFLPVFLYILPTEISKSDSISGPKLGPKGSERFAEPLNRTSNLPNLYLGPKNRTSNQPNLKKPNEPPNQPRFDPTLLPIFSILEKIAETFLSLFRNELKIAI